MARALPFNKAKQIEFLIWALKRPLIILGSIPSWRGGFPFCVQTNRSRINFISFFMSLRNPSDEITGNKNSGWYLRRRSSESLFATVIREAYRRFLDWVIFVNATDSVGRWVLFSSRYYLLRKWVKFHGQSHDRKRFSEDSPLEPLRVTSDQTARYSGLPDLSCHKRERGASLATIQVLPSVQDPSVLSTWCPDIPWPVFCSIQSKSSSCFQETTLINLLC